MSHCNWLRFKKWRFSKGRKKDAHRGIGIFSDDQEKEENDDEEKENNDDEEAGNNDEGDYSKMDASRKSRVEKKREI